MRSDENEDSVFGADLLPITIPIDSLMCICSHPRSEHQESAIGKPCMFWSKGTLRDDMIRCPCDAYESLKEQDAK